MVKVECTFAPVVFEIKINFTGDILMKITLSFCSFYLRRIPRPGFFTFLDLNMPRDFYFYFKLAICQR